MTVQDLSFHDLRFKTSHFWRFLARLIFYSFYSVLAASAGIFLLSDVNKLRWIGILIVLFLADRLFHLNAAEKSIVGLTRFPRLNRRKISDSGFKNINVASYFSPVSFGILERAYDKILVVGGDFYLFVLKFLVQLPQIKNGLLRMDVNVSDLNRKIGEFISKDPMRDNFSSRKFDVLSEARSDDETVLREDSERGATMPQSKQQIYSRNDYRASGLKNKEKISNENLYLQLENIAKQSFSTAVNFGNSCIEPVDLFAALGSAGDLKINQIFNLFEIKSLDLEQAMIFGRFQDGFWRRLPKFVGGFAKYPKKIRHRVMNRAWTAKPTPLLDRFSIDLTDLAMAGKAGFLIGRKNEYGRLVDILSRVSKPNALLVGDAGSGKESLVNALAFNIIKDDVPEALFDKRLVSLEINNLISGADIAEISSRLNKIGEEIISSGNVILYISDIHNLAKTVNGGVSAADVLMPIINNDAFPIIGAAYSKEFKQLIEPLSGFKDAFEIIRVEEISEDDAIKILTYESLILERQYKITISLKAIRTAVELSHKYFRQKLLPASAEDLLKETISSNKERRDYLLQADDIIAVAERKINIPIARAGKEEAQKLLNLENIIHQSLIDQETAVSGVSRALREYRSGLSRKGGPIASFLFVGPTGVGKTELAKIVAKIQFGSEEAMARFDMSEYQTKESIMRFIGTPDGKNSGNLTEAITQKPYSLILLDEFEKSHPDILNIFLAVFDDGRLTDNIGRTVDFTNTIIIATSNAHSDFIKDRIEAGDAIEKIGEELKKKLTSYFKPELLNRFSQVIVFKNLSQNDIEAIARFQLKSLVKTLEEQGISLNFGDEIVKKIAVLGYDPVFGARPLRGVISEKLRGVLAEKILKGEVIRGSAVKLELKDNDIKIAN
ncbi:ATP-dependent Clp protease ATP-binding subunit [Candidatus Wolfebacteria bacterium]|nr:ATP-dependent Clp protease ATP-binding subunit [Candidatus Wolfebacteria bacterium]